MKIKTLEQYKEQQLELERQEQARRNFMGDSYRPLVKENDMKIPTFEEYKQLAWRDRLRVRAYMKSQGLKPYHARTGEPSPLTGRPRPDRQGRGTFPARPHIWRSGPDEVRHDQYIAWARARSQAMFRGEDFELTYEDYTLIWADQWHNRGRQGYSMVMTRRDLEKGWTLDNTCLMERLQHIRRVGELRKLGYTRV